MSIVNVLLQGTCAALVLCDSESGGTIEPIVRGRTSKMLALPHVNAVIAVRGHTLLFTTVVGACLLTGAYATFDDLVDAMPRLLAGSFAWFRKYAESAGVLAESKPIPGVEGGRWGGLDDQTILLVGFSNRAACMQLHVWAHREDADGFKEQDFRGSYFGPAIEYIPGCEAPTDELGLKRIAIAQRDLMRRVVPAAAAGGKLILARLSRSSITFSSAGDLDASVAVGWLSAAPAGVLCAAQEADG